MRIIVIILIILIGFILNFNSKESKSIPLNINKKHMCALDSMVIINYKGPKAQILWKDDSRSYYCEVREAFYESTNKIKNQRIKAFFVQDFSNLSWDSYVDQWMLANDAIYVIDSNKDGAMGISYVPFSNIKCAKEFLNKYFCLSIDLIFWNHLLIGIF